MEEKIFMKIPDTANHTGLSTYFLRSGVRAGTIPHIRSGRTYYINVPKLLEQMNCDSVEQLYQEQWDD